MKISRYERYRRKQSRKALILGLKIMLFASDRKTSKRYLKRMLSEVNDGTIRAMDFLT